MYIRGCPYQPLQHHISHHSPCSSHRGCPANSQTLLPQRLCTCSSLCAKLSSLRTVHRWLIPFIQDSALMSAYQMGYPWPPFLRCSCPIHTSLHHLVLLSLTTAHNHSIIHLLVYYLSLLIQFKLQENRVLVWFPLCLKALLNDQLMNELHSLL